MNEISDEEILYNCYQRLGEKCESKNSKVDKLADRILVGGIGSKIPIVLTRLSDSECLSMIDIQKNLLRAKGLYLQYRLVRGRNSDCINSKFETDMDELLHALCKLEAGMLNEVRLENKKDYDIDLTSIFGTNRNLNMLGTSLARTIVCAAIKSKEIVPAFAPLFYVTLTGKKYHRIDCHYCKGKQLTSIIHSDIFNKNLAPCKCLESLKIRETLERTCVTAFVDESIHTVMWDEKGVEGKSGSYSYIICWGALENETHIKDENIIAQGVDYIGEHEHIERITETAVGKVLLTLLYDFDYKEKVQIFTDNISAVNNWQNVSKNDKLANCFRSVKVDYIPRGKNKKADKLGRSRVLLDMPVSSYNELVKRAVQMEEFGKKNN